MRVHLPDTVKNPISLLGVAVVTSAAALFLVLFLLESFGWLLNPYLGLLVFVTLPALFVAGLVLIPVGAWRAGRRRRLYGESPRWPVIDLGDRRQRVIAGSVLVLTFVNIVIVSLAGYGGVHYMESTQFCGQVCHETMAPEFEAHQVWPHARVACTGCHVGPGVGSFVEAKLAGTRQLYHLITGDVPKPIPTPVRSLGRTSDTCEGCHRVEQTPSVVLREIREYGDDEANTETATTLAMKVGTRDGSGIHRHIGLDIEYVALDETRQSIPLVIVRRANGDAEEFVGEGATEQIRQGARRQMDCTDCHNRPAHTFSFTPQRAVDRAIARGSLPRELPFVRREAVAAVSDDYGDSSAALNAIASRLGGFYSVRPDLDRALISRAITATQDAWARNVFPPMRVKFGTYVSNLGHVDSPGCFRCHDDTHKSADGKVISQDCELCHTIQ
jgi:hypothetical protein